MERIIGFAGTGVHFFFFLSGFSLTLGRKRSLGAFYRRRFTTVLIPYYVLVTFVFLFNQVVAVNTNAGLYAYLGHIFLFRMFDERIIFSLGYHLWFVSTIVQLYLLYPFLVKLKDTKETGTGERSFLVLALALSVIWWIVLAATPLHEYRIWRLFFPTFLWEFALGMVLADWYKQRDYRFWEEKRARLLVVAVVGMTVMALLAIHGGRVGRVLNDLPAFFGYAAVAVLVYRLVTPLRSVFTFVGDIAYPLYLVHVFPLSVLLALLAPETRKLELAYLPLVFFLQIALAWAFHRGYQKVSIILAGPRAPA